MRRFERRRRNWLATRKKRLVVSCQTRMRQSWRVIRRLHSLVTLVQQACQILLISVPRRRLLHRRLRRHQQHRPHPRARHPPPPPAPVLSQAQHAAAGAAAPKKKSKLPLILAGVLVVLLIGG